LIRLQVAHLAEVVRAFAPIRWQRKRCRIGSRMPRRGAAAEAPRRSCPARTQSWYHQQERPGTEAMLTPGR